MAVETVTRTVKRLYEQKYAQEVNTGIDRLLFPIADIDTSASFQLDRLITTPHAAVYVGPDQESHVLPYQAGDGTQYTIPIAKEKTPISEALMDAVIAGVEATAGYKANYPKLIDQIMSQQITAANMLRWYQAIQVLVGGTFSATGMNGVSLGFSIDFDRATALTNTYDFTAAGASMSIALAENQEELRSYGCSFKNMCILMGADWLTEYSSDSGVLSLAQNNAANTILQSQMLPPQLKNTEGLYVVGQFRGPGMLAPVWILGFSPSFSYRAYSGASATDWIADTKAVMFSLDSPRYRVERGVNVLDGNGKSMREVGTMVFDKYSEKDPVTDFIRMQMRHAFIPGNVNHTTVITGTFS